MPRVDDPNLLVNERDFPQEDYHCDDPEKAKLIKKLGRMITDYIPRQVKGVQENNVDFWILDRLLTKDEVKFMLSFKKKRVPYTMEQLANMNHMSMADTEAMVKHLLWIGILEQNRDNEDHHKQYLVPLWVVGSGEYMMMNGKLVEEHPEVATMFNLVPQEPVSITSFMVPPGGSGLGMHVIPVEHAIEMETESVDVEHLSHWLDKYDKFCAMVCSCRRAQRVRGEGVGDIEGHMCIGVGDIAEFLVESGKDAYYVTRDQVKEILQRAERKGYVHQITNIDGENRIVGICNCSPGSCYALRTSQLFNTPNMSRSAYRAHVDHTKCVACGKCVEVCPVGAAKLGQKLCLHDGSHVTYPLHELPDNTKWGPEHWDRDYRDHNKINCWPQGTSPCKTACPAHIAVQGYVQMAADGRYEDAVKLIRQDNPFPTVCGMICNHRCEDRCTRGTVDQPVAIDEIKKFLTVHEMNHADDFIPVCENQDGEIWDNYPIAVIGSGPAGLTAAYYLRKEGYPVTVFEKESRPGGMMVNGIPSFRLEKKYVEAEIDIIKKMGVEFKCDTEVGTDVTLKQLREQGYKAFYIAIGLQGGRKCNVDGEDAEGVESGVSFLKRINQDHSIKLHGDIVVVGGGNVAADVARAALRAGDDGAHVTMLCLEQRNEMPASKDEVAEVESEGIEVRNGWGPKEILTKDGKVTGIVFKKCVHVKDERGRFNPLYDDEDTITIPCSNILEAIGQSAEWGDLLKDTKVELRRNGTAVADPVTFQTGEPDIFVGGDINHGARFCIDAIADGREGMVSINRYVHPGQSLTIGRDRREFIEFNRNDIQLESYDTAKRAIPTVKEGDAKKSFDDFRNPLTEAQVRKEAHRCLHCGATTVDLNKCVGCGLCTTRCEFDAIHLSRDIPDASTMVKAEDKMKHILPYALKREMKIKFASKNK